jgi:hypothetical protein
MFPRQARPAKPIRSDFSHKVQQQAQCRRATSEQTTAGRHGGNNDLPRFEAQ